MSVVTDRQFTVPETALNTIVRMAHESREKIGTFDTEMWRKVIENEIAKVRDNAIREANADPQEMRMKAIAWDLRKIQNTLSKEEIEINRSLKSKIFPCISNSWRVSVSGKITWRCFAHTDEESLVIGEFDTEHEAVCHAAVAAKIEVNGKVLTEEDLK